MGRPLKEKFENRAIAKTYKINFRALTENEQLLLEILFKAKNAVLPWDIYARTIQFLVDRETKKPSELVGRKQNMEGLSQLGYGQQHLLVDIQRYGGIEKVAKHWRAQKVPIPAFSTVLIVLTDFKKSGLIGVRKIKSKEYYYLADFAVEQIADFIKERKN